MNFEERDVYQKHYWENQLPPFPYGRIGGPPFLLTPKIAARILVEIACGLRPRAAFALGGISGRTYERYRARAKNMPASGQDALPEHYRQDEIDKYLFGFFELQSMALEIARIQRTKAEIQIMQGSPTHWVTRKTIYKTKQAVVGGSVVTLKEDSDIKICQFREQPPRLPPFSPPDDEL